MEFLIQATLIGCGATLIMDLWSLLQKALFALAPPDFALFGRWIGHMPRGRFMHVRIADASPVNGELIIGWTVHYLIGILFAALLLFIWGLDWAYQPRLTPALIVGIATVAAPFLIMQPAMGAGIAAAKTPRPWLARFRSLMAHGVFGLGMYLSALAISQFS